MRIVSVSENHNIEKRIAITPDIAKKYIDEKSTKIKLLKNKKNKGLQKKRL